MQDGTRRSAGGQGPIEAKRPITDASMKDMIPPAIRSISVVTPIFNEEDNVEELVRRVTTVLAETAISDCELVVVDDGSRDRTGERLAKVASVVEGIGVSCVRLSRNFGHQAAVSAGLEHATGDVVVVMDGDLQDAPEEIPRFLDACRAGADVVYAVRQERKESRWIRTAYALHYRLASRLSRPALPRDSGDFCLMRRRVVDVVVRLPERQRYVRGLRVWAGFTHVGLPVERQPRAAGAPKYRLGDLIRLSLDGLFAFTVVPLRLGMMFGLLTMTLATIYAAYAVAVRLLSGPAPVGFTALIVMLVFLAGSILFFMGIVGEYVGRIYEEVKGRPIYVVESVDRFDSNG